MIDALEINSQVLEKMIDALEIDSTALEKTT